MVSLRVYMRSFFVMVIAIATFSITILIIGSQQTKTRDVVKYEETPTKSLPVQDLLSLTEKYGDFTDNSDADLTPTENDITESSLSSKRRLSLLIFGADRSGTTFISRMFSEDPNIFMIYEPLWITKRWRKDQPNEDWSRSELEVVNGILSCNFDDFPFAKKFLAHTSKNWAAAPFKNPFQTKNFCNFSETGKRLCPDFSSHPDFASEACAKRYKHSVTKVAQVRSPYKSISTLIPQVFEENPETHIKVIQILRDPRGSLNSRIQLGWMPKHTSPAFIPSARYACTKTAENVKYGRNLPKKYQERYMEVYYRDIAMFPIKTALKIYSFAGFDMPDELLKWIVVNTSPSEEALAAEAKKRFSSVRNSTANVEKWRSAPTQQNRIIEEECSELMKLIGIKK
ncbi:carbohydrate sulfotransferase 3-like [Montipora capricornis]|uniref:carbohydrate sulfotransferase 3-like n=1 Tax=Montipora capricornis TaxID=246305 RepID=UPI0035F127D5